MNQRWRTPIWPFLVLILCLFVLSIRAPRSWQLIAVPDAVSLAALSAKIQFESGYVLTAETGRHPPAVEDVDPPAEPSTQAPLINLSSYISPRSLAQFEPPAASRVELEVPVADDLPLPPQITPPLSPSRIDEIPPASDADEKFDESMPSPLPKAQGDVRAAVSNWPYPDALGERLTALSGQPQFRTWALNVLESLQQLSQLDSLGAAEAKPIFARLWALAAESAKTAETLPYGQRADLLRARYAILRRLAVWRFVREIASPTTVPVSLTTANPGELTQRISAVEARVQQLPKSDEWRDYLLIEQLKSAAGGEPLSDAQRRKLVRRFLVRLDSPALTPSQRALVRETEFRQLISALRPWASEPLDELELLDKLERYEQSGTASDAKAVARAYQSLRWSPDQQYTQLTQQLEAHYRNANLRVAISGDLINRLLPAPSPIEEPVDHQILGAQVYGRSQAAARLFVRLLPDRRQLRMGVEAHGAVASEAEAYKGPVVFHTEGLSRFRARKLLTIDQRGMRVWRSEAEAQNDTGLKGVESNYDAIPLLGSLVRSMALQQHSNQAGAAQWQVETMVADKASLRLDDEVHRRLAQAEQDFRRKVLNPLVKLKLNPTAVDLQTTEERLIVRYRLAGYTQLAAHTPRPQAPADSVLSVQVHQSTMNNVIEQLQLDGRTVELRELYRRLAGRLAKDDDLISDLPEGVTILFDKEDAVSIRCDDERVTLTLRIAKLSAGRGNDWHNFEVRAHFIPQSSGLEAKLVRDSYIELEGQRLRLRDQVALRGIFSKVYSQKRPLPIINATLAKDSRFQDLRVTQLVIDDGWIGLALGPKRRPAGGTEPRHYEARKTR